MIDFGSAHSRRALLIGGGAALAMPRAPAWGVDEAASTEDFEAQTRDDAADRLTTPVMIDGRGPYRFIVDTGANHTVLATEAADQLGLPRIGDALIHGVAGAQTAALARARSIHIGERRLRRTEVLLAPRAFIGADGFLGVDALEGQRLRLDFVRRRLSILASKPRRDETRMMARATLRFGRLALIKVGVGGGLADAFLDTGAELTIGNLALRRLIETARGEPLDVKPVTVVSATSQTADGEEATIRSLRLATYRVSNLPVVFADFHIFGVWDLVEAPALVVGMDLLRRFSAIEIDYVRRYVRIEPPPTRNRDVTVEFR